MAQAVAGPDNLRLLLGAHDFAVGDLRLLGGGFELDGGLVADGDGQLEPVDLPALSERTDRSVQILSGGAGPTGSLWVSGVWGSEFGDRPLGFRLQPAFAAG